jgi:arsenate reductase
MRDTKIFAEIAVLVESLDTTLISQERKVVLQPLIDFIQQKLDETATIRLNFVCTHNSRRSHLAQVWAQTIATYFGIPNVYCYSGGTEATALFAMAAETLKTAGFQILALSEGKNPIYSIKFGEHEWPIIGFSKTFNHPFNPQSGFAAIMTCSQADDDCPFIVGAEQRIPITYEDPKAFDQTPIQAEKYSERSLQIATELKFVFQSLKLH